MKKALFFALAALCVSAVQAITYGWTAWSGLEQVNTTDATGKVFSLGNVTASADNAASSNVGGALSAESKFTITNLAIAVWSTTSGQWDGDAVRSIGLALVKDGKVAAVSSATKYFFDGSNKIRWSGQGESTKAVLSFDFTGESAFDATTADDFTVAFIKTDSVGAGVTSVTVGDVLTDSVLYATTGNAIACDANGVTFRVTAEETIVPEPTALALLALGVAGLALKRKVA